MVLAGAYAELAGGAVVIERLDAASTERNQSLSTLGVFLGGDIGKSSVHMILSVSCGTCCNYGTGYQKGTTAIVNLVSFLIVRIAVACGSIFVLNCFFLTYINAVKTIHTSAVINLVVLCIYASGLASAAAFAAVYALALINDGTKQ